VWSRQSLIRRDQRRSLLPRKQIPHPAFEYLGKVDQFKVGDAPQAALDLSDTGAWDIPTSTLAGVLLRPIHRDSQTSDLRPNQIFVNGATVNDVEVITALTSTNLQTAPGSGVI
jgi:hypothetical protein